MLDGVILKGIGGFYYIDTVQGVYECRARGIFRKEGIVRRLGIPCRFLCWMKLTKKEVWM